MTEWYFSKYEAVRPEKPLEYSPIVESLWQFFAVLTMVLGAWYIHWRWTASLNPDALWYAVPLVIAETGAYIGLLLFIFNLWKVQDFPKRPAPHMLSEVVNTQRIADRPIKVDMFFATFDEEPELVRLSLLDAKKVQYPHNIDTKIYVLDDGDREEMKKIAEEEGVEYITRHGNVGFKAGNIRNAMEQTSGDFIVICDADTRPFPTMLEHTLGYFRDPDVAWVQTPQWFYDIPQGKRLPDAWKEKLGQFGYRLAQGVEKVYGPVTVGRDPFVNDPKMFFDVILRRRNWAACSFCCGAGSIHRRDAVMEAALRAYSDSVAKQLDIDIKKVKKLTKEKDLDPEIVSSMNFHAAINEELTPYKFHVSEDIYTSIILHSDENRNWKSVLHPDVESKMLSPQDLLSWSIQRFKYAGGTLDIALHDNPCFRKGMTMPARLMYAATIWSYLGGVWNIIFLISPLIYMYFAIPPVKAFSTDFFIHFFPFIIANEIASMFSTWGLSSSQAKSSFISFFSNNLRALWTVLKGQKISFPVTPKMRQEGNFLHLVWPQLTLIVLTGVGITYSLVMLFLDNPGYHASAVLMNLFWGLNNIFALMGIVHAATWKPEDE